MADISELMVSAKRANYKKAFDAFDKNGDSTIDISELEDVMRSLGIEPTKHEMDYWISNFDQGGSSNIEYDEFVKVMRRVKNLEHPILVFRQLDTDNSGKLNRSEIAKGMKKVAPDLENDVIENFIDHLDEDSDGKVSYMEFLEQWHLVRASIERENEEL